MIHYNASKFLAIYKHVFIFVYAGIRIINLIITLDTYILLLSNPVFLDNVYVFG